MSETVAYQARPPAASRAEADPRDIRHVIQALNALVAAGEKGDQVQIELGGRGQLYVRVFARQRPTR